MGQEIYQPLYGFKQRELDVLYLIAAGLTNEEIAAQLFIEVTTVRWYNRQIYSKLGVHSRTLAVAKARDLGLIELGTPPSRDTLTVSNSPSNLPAETTSFVGREYEITQVLQLLTTTRLLTLTGPGGTGKTRLAIRTAEAVKDDFPDGVWFIPLASVHDPALVPGAIANVLRVTETTSETLNTSLEKHLHEKQMLLVIDNFEHVIDAGWLLSMLLTASAKVRILVTSREVLHLSGEQEYPVPALSVPDRHDSYATQNLAQFEAVRLFVERARATQPNFQLTNENAEAVARICTRVDGLPLAIELAAARSKLLTPQQLLSRLERGFNTLGQGPRDAPVRQRTLSATIDWSYHLLSADEKILFNRLGIFRGGWTLEAMEEICAEGLSLDIFEGLAALVDKSLVCQGDGHDGEPRFTLLETLREYALDQLTTSGEIEELGGIHARYYSYLCESSPLDKDGISQRRWLCHMQADYDNVRAAMDWAEQHDPINGLRMIGKLVRFWYKRGHLVEGLHRTERMLAAGKSAAPELRLEVLFHAMDIADSLVERERHKSFSQEALTLAEQHEAPRLIARAMLNLASTNLLSSHLSLVERGETRQMMEVALAIFQEEGDTFYAPYVLNNLGELARLAGDDDEACRLYIQGLQLVRTNGDQFSGLTFLINLGFHALRHRDYKQSREHFEEALAIAEHKDNLSLMVESVEGLALVLGLTSDSNRAARLLGAAELLREQMGVKLQPTDQRDYEHFLGAIRTRLGTEIFDVEWAAGRGMSLEQLIDEGKRD